MARPLPERIDPARVLSVWIQDDPVNGGVVPGSDPVPKIRGYMRGLDMKLASSAVCSTAIVLSIVAGCLTAPSLALADVRVDDRIESRVDRREDRRENVGDGVEDRVEFREERRDCVGDGPDCRSDNRQDKREDRRDRAVDRVEDRGDRLEKRF